MVVGFHDDKELKPLALSKLIKALEQQGDTAEAENTASSSRPVSPSGKRRNPRFRLPLPRRSLLIPAPRSAYPHHP
jgi:hypothetical protein